MSAPTAAFTRLSEIQGERLVCLFELAVVYPTAQTWYLAETDLDVDALYSGSPAYQGLVAPGTTRPESMVAIGGAAAPQGLTLVLADHLGTYRGKGGRRRFSDQFVEIPAGASEPYDLKAATVTVRLAWIAGGLGAADRRTIGVYQVVANGIARDPEAEQLVLTCEADPTLYRALPMKRVTAKRWPNAPDESLGRPIPLAFGTDPGASVGPLRRLLVPGIPVGTSGEYVLCESPAATPVAISQVLAVWEYPITGMVSLQAIGNPGDPVVVQQNTTAGTPDYYELATSGGVLNEIAQSFTLDQGYLIDRIWITVSADFNTGIALTREVSCRIAYDLNGRPAEDLIDRVGGATVDSIGVGGPLIYEMVFSVPPWAPGTPHKLWFIIKWVEGQELTYVRLHASADGAARYGGGTLATRAAGEAEWQLRTPHDLDFQVHAIQYTQSVATVDGMGDAMAYLDFGRDLGGRPVGLALHGMQDDGSGTYTGTPAARIEKGADVLRWLAIAMAGASKVDTATFTVARQRLLEWHALQGVVYEELDGRTWMARVARDAKCLVYETDDGKLAIHADRGNTPLAAPVRLVRPWEHGPLALSSAAQGTAAAALMPWSKVEVFSSRDLMGIERFRDPGVPVPPGTRPETEWDGYAVISAEHTEPADGPRQTRAIALQARYGVRGNGGDQPGATEGTAAYFTGTYAAQNALRDYLFDTGALRPEPIDLAEGAFPRFAVGWRCLDTVSVESYEFPSASARCLPGEVHWVDAVWDGGSTQWYMARRGRFSVRGVAPLAAHGTDFPVHATLLLQEWETA